MPDEPEAHALLALMLLNDCRRDARFADGGPVLLGEQDRLLWDQAEMERGRAALERCLALRGRGEYALQAAIAALHLENPQDWIEIAALYQALAQLTGSPIVELNHAVAVAETGEVARALALLDEMDLDTYLYYHSARAELLHRLGRTADSRAAYEAALALISSDSERTFLERRLAQVEV